MKDANGKSYRFDGAEDIVNVDKVKNLLYDNILPALEKEVKNSSGEPRASDVEAPVNCTDSELRDKLARTYDSLLYVMSKYDEWYKEHGKNLQYSKVKKIRTAWESLKFCRRAAGAKLTWLKRWEKNDG